MVTNEKLAKRLQLVVVGACALMFILIIVLSFQIATRMNNRREEAALRTENQRLRNSLRSIEMEMAYMESWQFVEDFARNHLGWGRPGSSLFSR